MLFYQQTIFPRSETFAKSALPRRRKLAGNRSDHTQFQPYFPGLGAFPPQRKLHSPLEHEVGTPQTEFKQATIPGSTGTSGKLETVQINRPVKNSSRLPVCSQQNKSNGD